jgi:hypothetical protein
MARPAYLLGLAAAVGVLMASKTETGRAALEQLGTPRGIRNRNPGNIDWIANPAKRWRGMVRRETKAEGGRFGVFDTDANGVRAIGQELLLDERRGVRTLEGLISSWAPSSENNTKAYIAALESELHVPAKLELDVRGYLPRITAGIIRHENGVQPYALSDIAKWVFS